MSCSAFTAGCYGELLHVVYVREVGKEIVRHGMAAVPVCSAVHYAAAQFGIAAVGPCVVCGIVVVVEQYAVVLYVVYQVAPVGNGYVAAVGKTVGAEFGIRVLKSECAQLVAGAGLIILIATCGRDNCKRK